MKDVLWTFVVFVIFGAFLCVVVGLTGCAIPVKVARVNDGATVVYLRAGMPIDWSARVVRADKPNGGLNDQK